MQFLKRKNQEQLIDELCNKYNLERFEVLGIIKNAIAEIYGFSNVSISDEGSLIGLVIEGRNKYKIKYYNVSKDKYKSFKDMLSKKLLELSFKKIISYFESIVQSNRNMIYGRVKDIKDGNVRFKLYNVHNKEIKNFVAELPISEKHFFSNEYHQKLYTYEDEGFLFFVPKRFKVIQKNGIFKVKVVRVHEQVIRHKINSIFKELKEKLGKSYGYNKCIIDLKKKRITLFVRMFFSDKIQAFFKEELGELDDFEIIYINEYKKRGDG